MPVPSRLGNSLRLHLDFLFSSTQRRYLAHYGVDLGKQVAKKDGAAAVAAPAEVKKSKSVLKKAVAVKARGESRVLDKVTSPLALNLLPCSFFVCIISLYYCSFSLSVASFSASHLTTLILAPISLSGSNSRVAASTRASAHGPARADAAMGALAVLVIQRPAFRSRLVLGTFWRGASLSFTSRRCRRRRASSNHLLLL